MEVESVIVGVWVGVHVIAYLQLTQVNKIKPTTMVSVTRMLIVSLGYVIQVVTDVINKWEMGLLVVEIVSANLQTVEVVDIAGVVNVINVVVP